MDHADARGPSPSWLVGPDPHSGTRGGAPALQRSSELGLQGGPYGVVRVQVPRERDVATASATLKASHWSFTSFLALPSQTRSAGKRLWHLTRPSQPNGHSDTQSQRPVSAQERGPSLQRAAPGAQSRGRARPEPIWGLGPCRHRPAPAASGLPAPTLCVPALGALPTRRSCPEGGPLPTRQQRAGEAGEGPWPPAPQGEERCPFPRTGGDTRALQRAAAEAESQGGVCRTRGLRRRSVFHSWGRGASQLRNCSGFF